MIYVIFDRTSRAFKVGYSGNVPSRFSNLQTANPNCLELLWHGPGNLQIEAAFHASFKEYRMRGEWYAVNEVTEPFLKTLIDTGDMETAISLFAIMQEYVRLKELRRTNPNEFRRVVGGG